MFEPAAIPPIFYHWTFPYLSLVEEKNRQYVVDSGGFIPDLDTGPDHIPEKNDKL